MQRGLARAKLAKIIIYFVCLARFAGASSPPPAPNTAVLLRREHQARLEEISPLVNDVEIKKGDPFIEVFVSGTAHTDCYDVREYVVEKTDAKTLIVPRFRRSNSEKACRVGLRDFRDKAADLDPANLASYQIEVLGFRGWVKSRLARDTK